MRCLLSQPIFAKQGQVQILSFIHTIRCVAMFHISPPPVTPFSFKFLQVLSGRVLMVANAKQSYDLTIECKIEVNPKKLHVFNYSEISSF